jgi:hypothetical protein
MTRPLLFSAPLLAALSIMTAGATTPTIPMAGSVYESAGTAQSGRSCAIRPGQGSFQREAATTKEPLPDVMLSLPEVKFVSPSNSLSYIGVANLQFTSATAGKILFDDDEASETTPAKAEIPFTGYAQSYAGKTFQLSVKFTIAFKGCTLPVSALFRAAPRPHVAL